MNCKLVFRYLDRLPDKVKDISLIYNKESHSISIMVFITEQNFYLGNISPYIDLRYPLELVNREVSLEFKNQFSKFLLFENTETEQFIAPDLKVTLDKDFETTWGIDEILMLKNDLPRFTKVVA
jgi:hypothetical protein